jgi:hypothetical protein
MEMMLWNAGLSFVVGIMLYTLKGKFDEINRLSILLNRTREEMARDHITRAEFRQDMQQIIDRFDRLEYKIDRMISENKNG